MKKNVRIPYMILFIMLISLIISGCQAPRRPGNYIGLDNRDNTLNEKTQQECRDT